MKVAFLDRDGVINANRPDHVKSSEEFVFLPGALESLRHLREAGWTMIVVTNQAIIDRNIVTRATVEEINRRMAEEVERHGGSLDAVLYCPHRARAGCGCRKPRPGLLLQAAEQFGLQLDQCYLVGDALTDISAGQAVGCRCALVQTGRGRQQLLTAKADRYGDFHIAADLGAAVRWMMQQERRRTFQHAVELTTQSIFPSCPSQEAYQALDV